MHYEYAVRATVLVALVGSSFASASVAGAVGPARLPEASTRRRRRRGASRTCRGSTRTLTRTARRWSGRPIWRARRLEDFGEKEMAALRADRQKRAQAGAAQHRRKLGRGHRRRAVALVRAPASQQLTALARVRSAERKDSADHRGGAAARRPRGRRARKGRGPADSWTDRSLYDRCISLGVAGRR